MGSPNALTRQGSRRTALKEGDEVTVQGYAAKDGSNVANVRNSCCPTTGKSSPVRRKPMAIPTSGLPPKIIRLDNSTTCSELSRRFQLRERRMA